MVDVEGDGWSGVAELVGDLAGGVAVFVEFGGDHFAEGASADPGVAEAVEIGADLAGDVAGPVGGFDPAGVASSGAFRSASRSSG